MTDVLDPQVTPPGERTFSQDELNSLLAEERRRGEAATARAQAETEAVRRKSREAAEAVTGTVDAGKALVDRMATRTAEEAELNELRQYFGNTPGAGKRATELYRTNPGLYKIWKARYDVLTGHRRDAKPAPDQRPGR